MTGRVMRVGQAVLRRAGRMEGVARARVGARGGRGAILLYHRVATPAVDEWGLSVSPAAFAGQMELLASSYRPMPLAELVAAAGAGAVPSRAVAVTFDDGYVDNLEAALPVLERHSVPATIYVASGYVGRDGPFWWDEVERLLLEAPSGRPSELALPGLPPLPASDPAQRRLALNETVQPAMRDSTSDGIQRLLDAVREWAGGPAAPPDAGRCVTPGELERLAASPLIEIGAHTHRHPSLRAVGTDEARDEIVRSRRELAEHLGATPDGFSYPFGDLRRGTPRLVRDAGFRSAVATDWGIPVTRAADPFRLPREMVPDEGAEAFDRRVAALVG